MPIGDQERDDGVVRGPAEWSVVHYRKIRQMVTHHVLPRASRSLTTEGWPWSQEGFEGACVVERAVAGVVLVVKRWLETWNCDSGCHNSAAALDKRRAHV